MDGFLDFVHPSRGRRALAAGRPPGPAPFTLGTRGVIVLVLLLSVVLNGALTHWEKKLLARRGLQ